MDHLSHDEIARQIQEAGRKITLGADYAHYKDGAKIYRPKAFGTLEADDSLCVIYEDRYDQGLTFIRPVAEWLELVEWNGRKVPRFKRTNT